MDYMKVLGQHASSVGEAGRGFSVVADEVRKLVEKTMSFTTVVASTIQAIHTSSEQSIRQLESTVKVIEEATALVQQSGLAG